MRPPPCMSLLRNKSTMMNNAKTKLSTLKAIRRIRRGKWSREKMDLNFLHIGIGPKVIKAITAAR